MKSIPALWDVIIVGAGPVGLSLAKSLVRRGIRTLVLEKNSSLSKHSKAITIWPPTQQIFDAFGILSLFEKKGLCYEKVALHDADRNKTIIEFPLYQLKDKTRFPRLLILPQNKTEAILFENLQKENLIELKFNATASRITQKIKVVEVEYQHEGKKQRASGRFLVGCDGGDSFVRGELGIELKGKTFSQKAGLADIRLNTEKKPASPRLSNRRQLCIAFYIGDHMWRLIYFKNNNDKTEMDVHVQQAVEQLFGNKTYKEVWKSEFSLHSRISQKFAEGDIVLSGDAAHLNSPVGGQGMNAGIVDALRLAKAIVKSFEMGSNKPIHSYATQRKNTIEKGVNKNTSRITSLLFYKQGKYIKITLRLLRLLLKVPYVRKKFLLKMALLD